MDYSGFFILAFIRQALKCHVGTIRKLCPYLLMSSTSIDEIHVKCHVRLQELILIIAYYCKLVTIACAELTMRVASRAPLETRSEVRELSEACTTNTTENSSICPSLAILGSKFEI